MSFYNTYRPRTLEEIDNEQVRKLIASLLSKKKEDLPHAYFLTGPRGIGKTTTARIIAKLFNCVTPKKTGEPCGDCDMCKKIGEGKAIDVLEIDAASNTGVDNIRDIKDKILLAPVEAKWKIYIIDEVHMLSIGAFNALLKTLEEPPKHAVFILATTDPHKVPQTIQSRCLILQFKKPTMKELLDSLRRIVKGEGFQATDDALHIIAEFSDGSFRDAVKLLEQASLESQEITEETVRKILSLPEHQQVLSFIQYIQKQNAPELIQQIDDLKKQGVDIKDFYEQLIKYLHRMLIERVMTSDHQLWNLHDLRRLLETLLRFHQTIRGNVFPDLALELAILEYITTTTSPPQNASSLSRSSSRKQEDEQQSSQKQSTQKTQQDKLQSLSLEKLAEHWNDVIQEVKSRNHSVSAVLRSTRPKSVEHGIVTIEAFYKFHKEKLDEPQAKDAIAGTIKTLFGEQPTIDIVLGKKGV